MKTSVLDINGKRIKTIDLPKCFSAKIREDLVAKILEAKKNRQPYAPSLLAGKQQSAKGKMRHRRHVWQTHYGRGMSRIPRKVMSRSGTQFNWVGAEVPQARGGMRAHPPKVISMKNTLKINKKEMKIALWSALSATADIKRIVKKYSKLKKENIPELPIVLESKITSLKTKELEKCLENILGKDLFYLIQKKKAIRSGKGKLRGRKYKKNAGLLIIMGKDEKLKTNLLEVNNVENISITNLAKGGLGRLVLYTENAIKQMEKIK